MKGAFGPARAPPGAEDGGEGPLRTPICITRHQDHRQPTTTQCKDQEVVHGIDQPLLTNTLQRSEFFDN
jgi:hypothetical protein